MGLINKLLGGLFAFLGGLFGAIGKTVGLGKKSEYFLELEESKKPKSQKTEAPAMVKAELAEPAKLKAAATPVPPPAKPEASAPSTPPAQPVKAAKAEANPEAKPEAKAEAKPEAKPEPKAPAPQPVKSTPAPATPAQTFAPNFLVQTNSTNGRRRPGPSMNYFLDMAKQVKTTGA